MIDPATIPEPIAEAAIDLILKPLGSAALRHYMPLHRANAIKAMQGVLAAERDRTLSLQQEAEDRAGRLNVAGLTSRQADCLRFLADYQRRADGISPTMDEIKDGLGLASKSGVVRLLDGLEQRGKIARIPGRVRAITLMEAQ